jgi:hypothetical protein
MAERDTFVKIQSRKESVKMYHFLENLSPRLLALGFAAVTLSACASADVSAIKVASQDQIHSIMVSDVDVVIDTPKPYPALKAALASKLTETVPKCATGTTAHSMKVTVREFEEQNVAKAIFIGDEIELGGTVELIDAASGDQTGEYYVKRSFFWGGFIGAAMMSDAEVNLSQKFAESICSDVFGVNIEKKE